MSSGLGALHDLIMVAELGTVLDLYAVLTFGMVAAFGFTVRLVQLL